jgi:hypothetical protein
MNCYNCNSPLVKGNISEEHIINNSIGGRLKSKKILCIECNTHFGDTIDKELENQIGVIAELLGIEKERPKSSVKIELKTLGGKSKYVGKKMRPHDTLSIQMPGGKKIVITTDNPEKYEKLKKDKLKELAKHNMTYTEGIEEPTPEKFYFKNHLSNKLGTFGTGGYDYFRAIAKIALNYYLHKDRDRQYISVVSKFIKGNSRNNIVHFYYPIHYTIHDLKSNEISNIIHIKGDRECKILYAYIELMNMENFIIVFSKDYNGPEYTDTYCFDLNSQKEVNKEIVIKLCCFHFDYLNMISDSHKKNHEIKFQRITKLIEERQLGQ